MLRLLLILALVGGGLVVYQTIPLFDGDGDDDTIDLDDPDAAGRLTSRCPDVDPDTVRNTIQILRDTVTITDDQPEVIVSFDGTGTSLRDSTASVWDCLARTRFVHGDTTVVVGDIPDRVRTRVADADRDNAAGFLTQMWAAIRDATRTAWHDIRS